MPNLAEQLSIAPSDQALIQSSIRLSRTLLLSLALLCLYTFALHYFFDTVTSFAFNLWLILSLSFFLICGTTSQILINQKNIPVKYMDYYMMLSCSLAGILLSWGVYLIHFNLSTSDSSLDKVQILTLSTLLSLITATINLAFLTLRVRYFLLLGTPLLLPVFLAQFSANAKPYLMFYMVYDFAVIVINMCAYEAHKNHLNNAVLLLKHQKLIKTSEQQVQWTDELCQQLQQEMNKSKNIELELQLMNQLLEQKVKERTFDIHQMNQRLEHHSQNLALAHATAGIRAWSWDIAKRCIEIGIGTAHETTIQDWPQYRIKLQQHIHPDDLIPTKRALSLHLRGLTPRFEATLRVKNKQGQWRWVQDSGQVVSRDPNTRKPLRMVGMRRDIDQEIQDQAQLKLAATVVEQAAEGIFILNEQLRYIEVNPYFLHMTGLSRDAVIQRQLFDLNRDQQKIYQDVIQQLQNYGRFDGELCQRYHSGHDVDMWLHIHRVQDEQQRTIKYIGMMSDHTERKRQEQRLSYLQNYDCLTDLPNRMYYHQQLHQILVRENSHSFAVIRINIDRFRQLNEALSKHGADALLQQVAQRLRQVCQNVRLLAYLNGDDFAILYDLSYARHSAKQFAEHIVAAMQQPFQIHQLEQIITLSIGIAYYPEHGRQIDSLNNRAELALAEAKRLGGHTICDYSADQATPTHHAELEHELRKAIQNQELLVYYQPKLHVHNGQIMGFEALVRWNHPIKGILAPDYFIPIALESSLISDIGRVVILQTAQQIHAWNNAGFHQISVSVNVVAQQLHRGELLNDLLQALEQYPIAGCALELEITESSLIDNSNVVKDMLREVKRRDIAISLDDFGTGYSSLAYLTEFPIDILKIDRRFVAGIGDAKQDAIVAAMIAMGKAMGLTLVAEGVETEAQASFLKGLGCDIVQGYLYAKPLNAAMSTEYLRQHHFDATSHLTTNAPLRPS